MTAEPVAALDIPFESPARPRRALSFEQLVGGKLPIWVGGIALIFAAIFFVRYSIEQGLLGPGVRTVLAGIFGTALIGASEVARRMPRFADDPRVGQSLAGAGIASHYGTLYMAGELYFLIPPIVTIALMAVVTVIALMLSLRHGPPTAIMGLIGGFAAPLFAEPSGSLVPLLAYLGLLIAGLFAVAIHRGWVWLALAATGGGALWTLGIMLGGVAGVGPVLGLFIVALAVASALLLPRTGAEHPALRLLPILIGFVQLALFVPQLDFGYAGWALYGLLSAASLFLGYRDRAMIPAIYAALGLVLILLFAGFTQETPAAPWAAIGATLLFAVPGHVFARQTHTDTPWAAIALAGGVGPVFAAYFGTMALVRHDAAWAALFAAIAIPPSILSWRARSEGRLQWQPDLALFGGAVTAAILASLGVYHLSEAIGPARLLFAAMLVIGAALAWWARTTTDRPLHDASFAIAAGICAIGLAWLPFVVIGGSSLFGAVTHFATLPTIADAFATLALPAVVLGGIAWLASPHARRWMTVAFAGGAALLGLALLYTLAKQLLAIDTDARFVSYGFLERALLTQAVFAGSWATIRHSSRLFRTAGLALFGIAVFRLVGFDLLILNPLIVHQSVGSIPVLNIVTVHLALCAVWCWLIAAMPIAERWRSGLQAASLCLSGIAVAAAIRQVFNGAFLDSGTIGATETYAYSAALLALAIVWLWIGIRTGSRMLRVAGLAVLTAASLKAFLIDAAALDGLLRVLSFLALGFALIGIGWVYGRVLGRETATPLTATP